MAARVTQLVRLDSTSGDTRPRVTQVFRLDGTSGSARPRVTQIIMLIATQPSPPVTPPFEWEPCIPFEQSPVEPGTGDGLN
jgi:hypothetical protein